MNSKVKWTQLIGVAVLVALASVSVAGPVAAVPGIPLHVAVDVPPAGRNFSTRVRFEQYTEAQKQAESTINAVESDPLNTSGKDSRAHFEQYLAALALMEEARTEVTPLRGFSSRVAFEQYLDALKQMEEAQNAALAALDTNDESTRVRYQQYLEALKQMGDQTPYSIPWVGIIDADGGRS